MTTVKRPPKRASKAKPSIEEKRGQGRPVADENKVGKERLLDAAEKLLRELPPARVTIARIAQEASADPALVRYYFGTRTELLLAVVDRTTNHNASHVAQMGQESAVSLSDHIRMTLKFTRSAPFMHRLMVEELADEGTDASRARIREMNLDLVSFYRRALKANASEAMNKVNPLLLHLMVLGASDFFATSQPLIRELVPANTNMEKLAAGYEELLVKLVMNGLSKN